MLDPSTLLAIAYPRIDPVLVEIGPFAVRWYALSYIAGLVLGWLYIRRLAGRGKRLITRELADDILLWVTLGVVLGGRIGYVLFYQSAFYLEHPLEALKLWQGGMSFHGGLLGVAVALILLARRRGLSPFTVADYVACAAPIGLFFGRLANFINGELWGRPTDAPWAMVFPHPAAGGVPRHPSQLYEAALEGIVLFVLLYALDRWGGLRARAGQLTGAFCIGYGAARIFVELLLRDGERVQRFHVCQLPCFSVLDAPDRKSLGRNGFRYTGRAINARSRRRQAPQQAPYQTEPSERDPCRKSQKCRSPHVSGEGQPNRRRAGRVQRQEVSGNPAGPGRPTRRRSELVDQRSVGRVGNHQDQGRIAGMTWCPAPQGPETRVLSVQPSWVAPSSTRERSGHLDLAGSGA